MVKGDRHHITEGTVLLEGASPFFTSKRDLERILNEKKSFTDLRDIGCLHSCFPKIAESWIRARNLGVRIQSNNLKHPTLNTDEIQRKIKENQALIDAARPIFKALTQTMISMKFTVSIIDKNDILIYREGTGPSSFPALTPAVGTVWNEDTVGINAYSISRELHCPVQVPGVLHYSAVFDNLMGSVAPILDENQELIGSLTFVQPLTIAFWEHDYQTFWVHNLGLVTTIAAGIESNLRLEKGSKSSIGNKEKTLLISGDSADVSAILRSQTIEKIDTKASKRLGATASYTFEDLIGRSPNFINAIEKSKHFAKSFENILLIGESGTGKELFAQAIHNQHNPKGPFIAINCSAMPRNLIESELFGYEGGSFTGAEHSGRSGKIELAHGGTLFLDEIGDMPLEMQAVLLRVLEDKRVMRIGGHLYKTVNFRTIAATNKNLVEMVAEKSFRDDLFFRLSVLYINLPPLRDREEDIEIFIQYYLQIRCTTMGRTVPQISKAAINILKAYNWPGNVRELEHAIIYALNTEQGDVIEPESLPDYLLSDKLQMNRAMDTMADNKNGLSLKNLEVATIQTAIRKANYNIPRAAAYLEIGRSTLYRKLKEFNINSAD